ncbi:glycosyltransferase [Microbacterium sp.]|uniref:glycosyltransferase n=1 Tax=Microbacterium sp. TaxID=51671 RepID=UPI003A923528
MRTRAGRVLRRAQVTITDNDAVTARAIQLGALPSKVVSFPWGVDHEVFVQEGPNLRRELGINRDDVVILSVRTHEPLYDVQTLVRAFITISHETPSARLVLGGVHGSTTALLRKMLEQAGLVERVRFPRPLSGPALAALYRTADIYVSTSPVDGSSVSLLEAMSCGLPVVVTDVPGNKQWVDQETGWRFAAGDSRDLSGILQTMAADLTARTRRAEAGRSRAREYADWAFGKRALVNALQTAIASHNPEEAG